MQAKAGRLEGLARELAKDAREDAKVRGFVILGVLRVKSCFLATQ
jgi:hypothetical protein